MILLRRRDQLRRLRWRDIMRKDYAVIPCLRCRGKSRDHSIHLFRIVHAAPEEQPAFLEALRSGARGLRCARAVAEHYATQKNQKSESIERPLTKKARTAHNLANVGRAAPACQDVRSSTFRLRG